ncbi:MAG: lysophospholipid acyltransferase family protein [Pirellulaceae bacterium]|nr:lysophospholipid acyltransferase family protein [Pirellulaceae bacterium]
MHRLLPLGGQPTWTPPRLSPLIVRLMHRRRRRTQQRKFNIERIEVRGRPHLDGALEDGAGALIAPNHVTYPDPYLLAEVSAQVGRPFHYMTAWQHFQQSPLKRWLLPRIGCFSVDREGADVRSFRTAVRILQTSDYPLVVFPEGEMYHLNDRVSPFHDGPAAILLSACKKAERPIVAIPTAIKYRFLADPTDELEQLMEALEEVLFITQRPTALVDRIYRLAEALLSLKELDVLGGTQHGELPPRIRFLTNHLLAELEERYGIAAGDRSAPRRVKELRRRILGKIHEANGDGGETDVGVDPETLDADLEQIFLATQLMSYPGDYVAELASHERIAETIEKLEEDLLDSPLGYVSAPREAIVVIGEPMVIDRDAHTVTGLTEDLERRVQGMLDELATG